MSDNGNTVLGILAGTAIGVALGILFAPDKGSATRRRIADQAAETQHSIAEKSHELHDRAVNTLHYKKATLDAKLDHIVSDVSHKTEDIITTLEKKLAELKAKNKKLQKS